MSQANPDDPIGALRKEIRKCRSLTDKPFGVNVTILPILGKVDMDGIVNAIIEEGVKVVETAGRNPEKVFQPVMYIVDRGDLQPLWFTSR